MPTLCRCKSKSLPYLFHFTGFLGFLCVFETWLTDLTALGDVIALRFLLFLSHMYGAVLLLITPLIVVETLSRLLWPLFDVNPRTASPVVAPDGQCCHGGKLTAEQQKESNNPDKEKRLFHVVGYLCCLSVWVTVALNVRWRWKLEEMWSVACLHTTHSLVRCLPNLFSPIPIAINPCWGMGFFFFLLLLVTTNTVLHRRQRAPAQIETTNTAKHGGISNCDTCRQDPVQVLSAPSKPGMSASGPECIDPEKTESSCTIHRAYFWNSLQMTARHHGDFVLISSGCLSAEMGGQEHERTKRGTPLTLIIDSQFRRHYRWRQWDFPCLGVNVMIGLVGVLSIFVLPLSLSVNILLIRTMETLLELCLESLVSFAWDPADTAASHSETLV